MNLFYAPGIAPPAHTLTEEESRHCVRALRMQTGDRLHITDGRGNLYEARVAEADPRRCTVEVTATFPQYGKRPYRLTVAVAPTKNNERFEWFLEKATETGIDTIIPIECRNSERRAFKPERAEKVITGAIKQSLKAYRPLLEPLTGFNEVVARPFDGVKLIAHCRPESPRIPITQALAPHRPTLILIGPEGDFTETEITAATENGFTGISLGESRLRTETAAVAAVMAVYFKNLL